MPKPVLSIILPVYNAEKTIRKTVESVLAQSVRDFELIAIDDGSADRSGSICDEYAAQDRRVRVIHQVNAGVSAARNAGIGVSGGAYLGFVDADDWIAPDMFERLLRKASDTGADVVMCDAAAVYPDGRTEEDTISRLPADCVLRKSDFAPSLLLEMAGSVCRCIYSRRIFGGGETDPAGLRFPLGVKFSEDRIFNLYAMGRADRTAYVKKPYYYRYMNAASAVHRFHADYFEAYQAAAEELGNAIRDVWDDRADLQRAYLGQLITGAEMAICNYYYKTSPLSRRERLDALKKVCGDERLREAIDRYGADRKSKWILGRKYLSLILYAKLANLKHGR